MEKIKCDGIIFDMDGVLVDVSSSYRLAIKQTGEYVLRNKFNMEVTIDPSDIDEMKKIPGFNNDWDLSYELIQLLRNRVTRDQFTQKAKLVDSTIQKSKDYQEVKDIFQTYYLGEQLFFELYNRPAPFSNPRGLIENEKALIDENVLETLGQKYPLGVATSRPRFEALFALRNLGITPRFIKEEYIVAQEDTDFEKPDPAPLIEAKRRMGVQNPSYIGDSINDKIAASRAGFFFIGIGLPGDIQVASVNQSPEVIS